MNIYLAAAVSDEICNIKKELAEGQFSRSVSVRQQSNTGICTVRTARDEAIELAKEREVELNSVKSAAPLMAQALAMLQTGVAFK